MKLDKKLLEVCQKYPMSLKKNMELREISMDTVQKGIISS